MRVAKKWGWLRNTASHSSPFINKNVDVAVTSVLQTAAGRMIFTKLREDMEHELQTAER